MCVHITHILRNKTNIDTYCTHTHTHKRRGRSICKYSISSDKSNRFTPCITPCLSLMPQFNQDNLEVSDLSFGVWEVWGKLALSWVYVAHWQIEKNPFVLFCNWVEKHTIYTNPIPLRPKTDVQHPIFIFVMANHVYDSDCKMFDSVCLARAGKNEV